MTNFDPAQHPRQNPALPGAFSIKYHTDPETDLAEDTIGLSPGESIDLEGDDYGPIGSLTVNRLEGHRERYRLESEQWLHLEFFIPNRVSSADRVNWLINNQNMVKHFFENRYKNVQLAPVGDGSDDMSEGDAVRFTCTVSTEHDGPLREEDAYNLIWNNTDAVLIFNEIDPGTYGAEDAARIFKQWAQEMCVFTGTQGWEAAHLTAEDIDREVAAKLGGEEEIRDVTAIGIANAFDTKSTEPLPGIHRLATEGWAEREALTADLGNLYSDPAVGPREKRRLDMMFTWLLHRPDSVRDLFREARAL